MNAEQSLPLKVLLVDDHQIVRAGLRTIISRAGIEVVGEAGTAAAAIEEAARLEPDVVLMDVRLPDGSGVTACRELRAASPRTRVLFISAFKDDSALLATAFASASGYLLKEIGADMLIHAIKGVASGLSVLGPGVVHSAIRQSANPRNRERATIPQANRLQVSDARCLRSWRTARQTRKSPPRWVFRQKPSRTISARYSRNSRSAAALKRWHA